MRGLLSTRDIRTANTPVGLLGIALPPVNRAPMPAAAPAPAAPARRERVSPWRIFDRVLGGQTVSEALDSERARPIEEQMRRQRLEATTGLMDMFAPSGSAGAGQQAGGGPSLPSLRSAAPALIAAQLAGVEGVGGIRETLEAIQPELDFINGVGVDKRDPSNVGQRIGVNLTNVNGVLADLNDPENRNRFIPDVPEGAMPLYDGQGNVVAIRNIDGTVEATAERERAVNDARNASQASYAGAIAGGTAAGQAPYQIETVQGPDGRPIVTSRANILAQGGIAGQSPAEQAAAVDLAKGDAARENARADRVRDDEGQASVLQEALDLLPDVITGFGADARLLAARARAGFDPEAQRRVEATETFRSVMGQRVLAVARQLGSGSGITDADRKFAQDIAGGNIELNEGTIRRLLQIEQRAAARRRGQAQVSREAALAELRRRGLIR